MAPNTSGCADNNDGFVCHRSKRNKPRNRRFPSSAGGSPSCPSNSDCTEYHPQKIRFEFATSNDSVPFQIVTTMKQVVSYIFAADSCIHIAPQHPTSTSRIRSISEFPELRKHFDDYFFFDDLSQEPERKYIVMFKAISTHQRDSHKAIFAETLQSYEPLMQYLYMERSHMYYHGFLLNRLKTLGYILNIPPDHVCTKELEKRIRQELTNLPAIEMTARSVPYLDDRQRTQTRVLAVKCETVYYNRALELLRSSMFPQRNCGYFIHRALQFEHPKIYAECLRSNRAYIKTLAIFNIYGLHPDVASSVCGKPSFATSTIRDYIEQHSSIDSVQPTTQSYDNGLWKVITTYDKAHAARAWIAEELPSVCSRNDIFQYHVKNSPGFHRGIRLCPPQEQSLPLGHTSRTDLNTPIANYGTAPSTEEFTYSMSTGHAQNRFHFKEEDFPPLCRVSAPPTASFGPASQLKPYNLPEPDGSNTVTTTAHSASNSVDVDAMWTTVSTLRRQLDDLSHRVTLLSCRQFESDQRHVEFQSSKCQMETATASHRALVASQLVQITTIIAHLYSRFYPNTPSISPIDFASSQDYDSQIRHTSEVLSHLVTLLGPENSQSRTPASK